MKTKKKDTQFVLSTFFEQKAPITLEYEELQKEVRDNYINLKRVIKEESWLNVETENGKAKIYSPRLALILTSSKLLAFNKVTQSETVVINGLDYLETFIQTFKEGEQYFENEIKVSPNNLYGSNAEQYVKDIHSNFFHIQHVSNGGSGWRYVKQYSPLMISHKAIKEFGYYSGIVSKVEEQIKKHPEIFRAFGKGVDNNSSQKGNDSKFDFVNNFDEVEKQLVYGHFKSKLVDKNYLSIEDLHTWLANAFQKREKTEPKLVFDNRPHKQKIREIFFEYSSVIASQHGRRKEYIELLTEHFTGHPYTQTVNNFKPKDYK